MQRCPSLKWLGKGCALCEDARGVGSNNPRSAHPQHAVSHNLRASKQIATVRERFAFAPARRLVRTAAHPFQAICEPAMRSMSAGSRLGAVVRGFRMPVLAIFFGGALTFDSGSQWLGLFSSPAVFMGLIALKWPFLKELATLGLFF